MSIPGPKTQSRDPTTAPALSMSFRHLDTAITCLSFSCFLLNISANLTAGFQGCIPPSLVAKLHLLNPQQILFNQLPALALLCSLLRSFTHQENTHEKPITMEHPLLLPSHHSETAPTLPQGMSTWPHSLSLCPKGWADLSLTSPSGRHLA